jgi:PAS domain-containing protein
MMLYRQFVYDISNLKQAEELVIKERNKAHQYIDAAGSLIGVVNTDMKIVLVNKKACEVLGYDENEVLVGTGLILSFRTGYAT